MSVNNVKNSPNVVNPNSIQTSDTGKAEKASPKNAAAAYAKAGNPPSVKEAANVQISQRAKEMSMAKKVAEETPDVREDKVAQFRDLIEKGEYKADSEKIANAIVQEAMRDEIARDPGIVLR
ncbi:flagellar biosynthesis anti-sigma factor FlgM [Silvanigrella paludirubra]|uniref:Negative regulator of flagellin synthesis n=1 Tax=Silvanigrella paludirubra TaxID=2499159 RepID=A0A6N6VS34_9BACT|nr:flagellar biosynthesis anti-sigma factor FlgM [Silvanigrella paludirubra]KAB8037818.1 flagellar biosynthesis anti-sigma factor FlgM [Silvanigrella paludirubra]